MRRHIVRRKFAQTCITTMTSYAHKQKLVGKLILPLAYSYSLLLSLQAMGMRLPLQQQLPSSQCIVLQCPNFIGLLWQFSLFSAFQLAYTPTYTIKYKRCLMCLWRLDCTCVPPQEQEQ